MSLSFQPQSRTPASSPIPRPCLKRSSKTRPPPITASGSLPTNSEGNANASLTLATHSEPITIVNANASPRDPSHTHIHVHFPATPLLHSTYLTHSKNIYDRRPVAVVPNVCAMPKRGSPGRRYIGGIEVGREDDDDDADLASRLTQLPLSSPTYKSKEFDTSTRDHYTRTWSENDLEYEDRIEDEEDAESEDIVGVMWMKYLPYAHLNQNRGRRERSRSKSKSGSREERQMSRSGSRSRSRSGSRDRSGGKEKRFRSSSDSPPRNREAVHPPRLESKERRRHKDHDGRGRWKTGLSISSSSMRRGSGLGDTGSFGLGVDDGGCFGGF